MKRERAPHSVGEIISHGLPGRVASRLPGPGLMAAWREAAGPAASARAWPVCLEEGGRLVVAVRGNVWRQELTLLLPTLLASLSERGQALAEIKLVQARTPAPPPPEIPPPPPLTAIEEAEALAGLDGVRDPGLRESLASLKRAQMRAAKVLR